MLLDAIDDLYKANASRFKSHPLRIGGSEYQRRRKNDGRTFGLTPILEKINEHVIIDDDDDDDDDDDASCNMLEFVDEVTIQEQAGPIISTESQSLLLEICKAALASNAERGRTSELDWIEVTMEYNNEIGRVKIDRTMNENDKARYTFALQDHVKSAYSQLMENLAQNDAFQQLGPEMKGRYLQLRKYLKDSTGYSFDAPVPVGTQDVGVADASASSSMEHDPKYAESIYGKVFSPPDGQWTEDLIKQRLQVLEKVEWCANCGEICKVKEGEGWRVYGDKHESAARSNYHPFCDKRIPDRLRVRNHGRLKIKERKSLLRAKVNLKGLPTNWRRRLAPKKRD